ncbi:leucine-rich repeat domain-containing protein [bacterium]|nr:leucine-rich repeat domain-containing protein [bacterium]
MGNVLKVLKKIQANPNFQELTDEELTLSLKLVEELGSKIQEVVFQRSQTCENDDDNDEFIEIVIDGKPDLIKKNIQVLNISCNRFKTLPAAIFRLKNLRKLYLYSNSFSIEEKKKIRRSFPPQVQIYF